MCTEAFCVSVCAEGSGADAEVADSQGCRPRVLVSSRYPSLLFVTVVALNKTHKQDTKSHKPISLSVPDLTWLTAPETLSCVFMCFCFFFFLQLPCTFALCVCVYVGLCVWKIRAPELMQGPRCDSRAQHIVGLVDVQPSSSEPFDRLVGEPCCQDGQRLSRGVRYCGRWVTLHRWRTACDPHQVAIRRAERLHRVLLPDKSPCFQHGEDVLYWMYWHSSDFFFFFWTKLLQTAKSCCCYGRGNIRLRVVLYNLRFFHQEVFVTSWASFDLFRFLGDFSSLSSSFGPPCYNLMTGKQVKTFTIGISGSLSSHSVFAACGARNVGRCWLGCFCQSYASICWLKSIQQGLWYC